jgi:hypothetical protein
VKDLYHYVFTITSDKAFLLTLSPLPANKDDSVITISGQRYITDDQTFMGKVLLCTNLMRVTKKPVILTTCSIHLPGDIIVRKDDGFVWIPPLTNVLEGEV